eukprot:TRINITY_DN612_c0_g1_i1.p1 TRINITY_DN612_c0_g1~~TRINITY_DN612_c0_g1_i1.p1  ORF type:complete len:1081 (+),score=230.80 TRINITY_DN612_c0_g1_i1:27-3245(+)
MGDSVPLSPPPAPPLNPTSPVASSRILKQTIVSLKDQNVALNQELHSLKNDMRRCSAEKLTEIKKRLSQKAALQKFEQEVKTLRSELDDQRAATLAASHQLRKSESRILELSEETRQLLSANAELERRSEEAGATLGAAADERRNLRLRERELKDTIRSLQSAKLDAEREKDAALLQLQKACEERKQAQTRAAHYESRYRDLKGAAGAVATRSDTMDKQLDDLQSRTVELQANLKLAKSRATNADARCRDLKERVTALEAQLADSERSKEEFAEQVERLQADAAVLHRVEARLKKTEKLVKTMTQVDVSVAEERDTAVARRDRLLEAGVDASPGSNVDQALQDLEDQLASLRHANRILLRSREEAVAVTDRLQREFSQKEEENKQLSDRISNLEQQIQELLLQNDRAENSSRVAEQQALELRSELQQAMEGLDSTGSVIRELQSALHELETERHVMRKELETLRGHTHRVTLESQQQRLELQFEVDFRGICAQEAAARCALLDEESTEWQAECSNWHDTTRKMLQQRHQLEQRGEKQRVLLHSAEFSARMRLEGEWAENFRAIRVNEVESRLKRLETLKARDAAERRVLRSPSKGPAPTGRSKSPVATKPRSDSAPPQAPPKAEVRRPRFAEAEAKEVKEAEAKREEEVIMLDCRVAEEVTIQQEPSVRAVLMAEERGARILLHDQYTKEGLAIEVQEQEHAVREELQEKALQSLRKTAQEWRRRYDLELGEVVARAIVCGEEKGSRRALGSAAAAAHTQILRACQSSALFAEESELRNEIGQDENGDWQTVELLWSVWQLEALESREEYYREELAVFEELCRIIWTEESAERGRVSQAETNERFAHVEELRTALFTVLDDAEQHWRWRMERSESELRTALRHGLLFGTVPVEEERWRKSIAAHEGLQWRQLILEERQAMRSVTARFHSRMSSVLPSGLGLNELQQSPPGRSRMPLQACYDGLRMHQLEAEEASARARLVNESAYHTLVALRRVRLVDCVQWETVLAALQTHEEHHRQLVSQMQAEELLCLLGSLAPHKQISSLELLTMEPIVSEFERTAMPTDSIVVASRP